MKRFYNFTTIAALLALVMTTGCFSHWGGTKGSGKVTEQVRSVADFKNVNLKGVGNLFISQGDKNEIKIVADDNLMERIETDVDGNTLNIDMKHIRPTKIEFHITMKEIKGLKISGSGDIVSKTPISTDKLYLTLSGSGDINVKDLTSKGVMVELFGSGDVFVSGKVNKTKIKIAGSGDVNCENLESDDVDVDIAGSGNCTLYAKEALSAKISGSGDIRYKGEPKDYKASTFGSGSIKKLK